MSLPPAQPSTNLQPQRTPVDPSAALQAQEAAQQQQQAQMMQMVMALIMHMVSGQAGTGGGMGAPQAQPGSPDMARGGMPPTAPPVPGQGL